ncbi:MAG: MFS transporter [Rhodothermales bacterium]|nr:MFS transporter [Rhodothermales bacterium]MBO6778083.1 MFS transporter [Rhodothermales bacterium]
MTTRPRLSFWQIWNLSFGFLGIQFGWALQLANVSRIFQTLGADIGDIAILWVAAPVTGLLVQPIVGHFSDRTWTRLGRRRPYFLAGAVLASLSLLVMPGVSALWMAAGLLWILDTGANVSMEPFRAFVGDMLPPEQRTLGFATQSFFIGIGSVVASAFPWMLNEWLGVANTAPEGVVPPTVRIAFMVGAGIFLAAVCWTVFTTREYPPEQLEAYNRAERGGEAEISARTVQPIGGRSWPVWLGAGVLLSAAVELFDIEPEVHLLAVFVAVFGVAMGSAAMLQRRGSENGFVEIIGDIVNLPDTLKDLAWVQGFSWFGLFSMFLYTTAAVTEHVYGTSDTTSALYNEGANWVGIMFGAYNAVAAAVAFGLPVLAGKVGMRWTHAVALILGGIGLAGIYIVPTPGLLLVPMIGVGIAWASILAMPYAMLSGGIPGGKLGVYMGIFNFFIVIPQIIAATLYGTLLSRLFDGQAVLVLICGGLSLLVAAALTLRVRLPEGER